MLQATLLMKGAFWQGEGRETKVSWGWLWWANGS